MICVGDGRRGSGGAGGGRVRGFCCNNHLLRSQQRSSFLPQRRLLVKNRPLQQPRTHVCHRSGRLVRVVVERHLVAHPHGEVHARHLVRRQVQVGGILALQREWNGYAGFTEAGVRGAAACCIVLAAALLAALLHAATTVPCTPMHACMLHACMQPPTPCKVAHQGFHAAVPNREVDLGLQQPRARQPQAHGVALVVD